MTILPEPSGFVRRAAGRKMLCIVNRDFVNREE